MSDDGLAPHRKGDLTEAVVIAALKRRGIPVALPFGDSGATTCSRRRLRDRFKLFTVITISPSDRRGGVDWFLVSVADIDELYLVDADEVGASMSLRLDVPEGAHGNTNVAAAYEFDTNWPP